MAEAKWPLLLRCERWTTISRSTKKGRERPIRLMTNMNSHIALRQAGIGQLWTFTLF